MISHDPSFLKIAAASQNLVELEAFSALKQSNSQFILEERARTGLACDLPAVIQACIQHFNWGANPEPVFQHIIKANCSVSTSGDTVGMSLGVSPSPGGTTICSTEF